MNFILSSSIDGVQPDTTFPTYNHDIFVCTSCNEIMNPDGLNDYIKMVEHIKSW